MRTRIGRSSFIIFTVVAAVLAVLAGCGSGRRRSAGGGSSSAWYVERGYATALRPWGMIGSGCGDLEDADGGSRSGFAD